jgi:5-methylcytosine-specific restriction endonuclease McrA
MEIASYRRLHPLTTYIRPCRQCGSIIRTVNPLQRLCSRLCKARFESRARAGGLNRKHRLRLLDRDGWVCYLCRRPIDPSYRYPHPLSATIDHVKPVSAGGSNTDENLRSTHWRCNIDKGDAIPGVEMWIPLGDPAPEPIPPPDPED